MSTPAPVLSTAAFTLVLNGLTMDVVRISAPVTAITTTASTGATGALKTAKGLVANPDPWWELSATLAYMANASGLTYRETYQGSYDAVLKKAQGRIVELAKLKTAHDAVHVRVVAMSEGQA